MKQGIIYAHSCAKDNIIIPRKEVIRYMGCLEETTEAKLLLDSFFHEVREVLDLKGSFVYLPVCVNNGTVCLADSKIESLDLSKNLLDCDGAVVFSLSIGTAIDRLISKYSHVSPSAALCINAIGSAAIEAYADMFSREISDIFFADFLYTRPRFSPGYGDFPLDFQPLFIKLTNAGRNVGITLADSLVMMPSKSVTAIMGVSRYDSGCIYHGCEICSNKSCKYKR